LVATKCSKPSSGRVIVEVAATETAGRPLLSACKSRCKANLSCEGFIVHDNGDGFGAACRLLANIDIVLCEKDEHHNLWLNPTYVSSVKGVVSWLSFVGRKCSPGHGVGRALSGRWAHESLADCEKTCENTDGCEAVFWRGATNMSSERCDLRSEVDVDACEKGEEPVDVRVVLRAAASTRAPSTPAPSTRAPSTMPRPALRTSVASGLPPGASWPILSGLDCRAAAAGASHGHWSIRECLRECAESADCVGVAMKDDGSCSLRVRANATRCAKASDWSVWLRPRGLSAAVEDWVAHASTRCDPEKGADYAIEGVDALGTQLSLQECESFCASVQTCEAVVWHNVQPPSCHLRRNIRLENCSRGDAFSEYSLQVRRGVLARDFSVLGVESSRGAAPLTAVSAVLASAAIAVVGIASWTRRAQRTFMAGAGRSLMRSQLAERDAIPMIEVE